MILYHGTSRKFKKGDYLLAKKNFHGKYVYATFDPLKAMIFARRPNTGDQDYTIQFDKIVNGKNTKLF